MVIMKYMWASFMIHMCLSVRLASRVLYDGGNFKGWQDQGDGLRTVQRLIGDTISLRTNRKVTVTGAGRTDLGVHAKGQALHFDLETLPEILGDFEYSINRMLPDDVKLFNLSLAPPGTPDQVMDDEPWHATKSAIAKIYSYTFCTNKFVEPLRRRYCTHIYHPMDMNRFEECLQLFVGKHNFSAFTNNLERTSHAFEEKNKVFSTERTIFSAQSHDLGKGYYRVDFHLDSALYKMVRNIMASSFAVASGRLCRDRVESLLAMGGSRSSLVVMPAPPEGLCLDHVFYHHY